MARSAALTLVLPHFDTQVNKLQFFPLKAEQGCSLGTTSYSVLATHLIVSLPVPLNEQLTGLLPLATIFLITQTDYIISFNYSEVPSGGFPSCLSGSGLYSPCPQGWAPAPLPQTRPLSAYSSTWAPWQIPSPLRTALASFCWSLLARPSLAESLSTGPLPKHLGSPCWRGARREGSSGSPPSLGRFFHSFSSLRSLLSPDLPGWFLASDCVPCFRNGVDNWVFFFFSCM